jgi:hypothetical protein
MMFHCTIVEIQMIGQLIDIIRPFIEGLYDLDPVLAALLSEKEI